jgi:hypothetical protein
MDQGRQKQYGGDQGRFREFFRGCFFQAQGQAAGGGGPTGDKNRGREDPFTDVRTRPLFGTV